MILKENGANGRTLITGEEVLRPVTLLPGNT